MACRHLPPALTSPKKCYFWRPAHSTLCSLLINQSVLIFAALHLVLTGVPKSTWILFLGISVLSYWDHVFFRACPVPSHRRIHTDSFPELELWTLILFLLNLTLLLFSLLPFPLHPPAISRLRVKSRINGNTLKRGLCPYGGGLTSISRLGGLSCTSQLCLWLST